MQFVIYDKATGEIDCVITSPEEFANSIYVPDGCEKVQINGDIDQTKRVAFIIDKPVLR